MKLYIVLYEYIPKYISKILIINYPTQVYYLFFHSNSAQFPENKIAVGPQIHNFIEDIRIVSQNEIVTCIKETHLYV